VSVRLSTPRPIILILLVSILCAPFPAAGQRKYWISFADKGPAFSSRGTIPAGSLAENLAKTRLQQTTMERRARHGIGLTAEDMPLYQPYVDAVRSIAGTIAQTSRWCNAVSASLSPAEASRILAFPFVSRIEPVRVFRRPEMRSRDAQHAGPPATSSFDYGGSAAQLAALDILPLHDIGITGKGVIVGLLDSGFRWRTHDALRSRTVLAEHDFIFNDNNTANQPGDTPGQDDHGTLTMSLIAGYMPGMLIGSAFGAGFLLGKTELIYPSEASDYDTKIEEDNWVAGLEWMESHGADVVSSSLGYNDFVDSTSYSWENGDFNGRTTASARAAAHAAALGVVVCTAMGNEGNGDGLTGTLLTPADADSILSIGAVDFSGAVTGFSSTGPTNDGRIKPDLVAPGVRGVVCAIPPNSYSTGFQGTSLSTPLIAGTAALLISARPELTPLQVRDILRSSAKPVTDPSRFPVSPNNFSGWGEPDALNALLSVGPVFGNSPRVVNSAGRPEITANIVSKFGIIPDSVKLFFTKGRSAAYIAVTMTPDSSMFFPTSGRYRVLLPPFPTNTLLQFYIEAADSAGRRYRSPAPVLHRPWEYFVGRDDADLAPQIPAGYRLYQNYPNPFNGSTVIQLDLPLDERISLKVYNVLGREVATIVNGIHEAGTGVTVSFDPGALPSGIYFYRLATASYQETRKMLLIR
jgi:serine protease AprX